MTTGGAVVFGRSVLGRKTEVNSDLGSDPRSSEGLIVGGSSTTCDKYSMASRSVSILSMLVLMTSGFLS